MRLDPRTSHDLSFPFNMVKRGWRAVYEPAARAVERPVPSIEGEFRRKRRMMSHAWPAVLGGGMLNPRGYGLDVRARDPLAPCAALRDPVPARDRAGRQRRAAGRGLGVRRDARGAARAARRAPRSRRCNRRSRVLALCRYYVLMTASLAAGLWDALRHGTPATWEREPERPVVSRAAETRARRRAGAACSCCWRRRSSRSRPPRSSSPAAGPSIYRQRRVGKDGVEFDLLKLRTMVAGAEQMGAGLAVDEGDPRITRVGALLRRWSLDELPNLVNVLKGDMSIVGPRPTVQSQVVAVHAAPARAARGRAGHHRLGAGERARGAPLARAHRARPLVHRALVAAPRPAHPRAHGAAAVQREGPLPRRDGRLAPAAGAVATRRGTRRPASARTGCARRPPPTAAGGRRRVA